MKCEKCGASYEGNSCPNGCNATAENKKAKKPVYKKWWFWAIIAVVVIAVASGGSGEDAPAADDPASTNAPVNTDGGDSGATTVATEAAKNTYAPGDVINANGLQITYVKAEKYVEENMFLQPEEGYMYIRLYLSVENKSDSDKYISSFEFTCYADGKKEESYYSATEALEGGTLSAGRKDEGYIYFKVPVAAEKLEVEYETSFWTDKKAILTVSLNG